MKYVELIGSENLLYKIIKEKKNYVLIYDPYIDDFVWERKDYIKKVYEL